MWFRSRAIPFDRLAVASWLVLVAFAILVYAKYVIQGGFIYDDWSVVDIANMDSGYWTTVSQHFFRTFPTRPFAPLYYGFTTKFKDCAAGYILLDLMLWSGSIALIAAVLRNFIGDRSTLLFAFIAVIPTLSTTVIFSPAMQSLGALAIFLWALSFLLLNMAMVRSAPKLALLSLAPIALMCGTYEVAMPLMALSLVWPLMPPERSLAEAVKGRFFIMNTVGILSIVAMLVLYQKLVVLRIFPELGDTSRLRITDPFLFLHNTYVFTRLLVHIMVSDAPALLIGGARRLLEDRSSATLSTWLGGMLILLVGLRTARCYSYLTARNRLLILMVAILAGMFGVGLLHAAASVPPEIQGYMNRGLSAFSLLLPMLLAVACSIAYRINRWLGRGTIAVAVGFFGVYLASFIVQRDNYIAAVRVQSEILSDLVGKLAMQTKSTAPFLVLANVPEFLATNFNDETIFSDEVTDWNLALKLYSRGKAGGATLTAKKLCSERNRVVMRAGRISMVEPLFEAAIAGAWYYEYDIEMRIPILLKIRDEAHLREILQVRISCARRVPASHP